MTLLHGMVHVWWFDLDQNVQLDLLSADERARAARFHFERDARRWQAGRSLLRQTLGGYLDIPPKTLSFETGPFGKPHLNNSRLRFNISHSGALLLLAFAWDQEVGVDVEHLRCDFAPEELAVQVFSVQEQEALCRAAPAERHAAFLSLWTAKEAYVKALGSGLSFLLPQLTLSPISGTDRYAAVDNTQAGARAGISVCRLPALPGCAASLAVAGTAADIQHFNCFYVP